MAVARAWVVFRHELRVLCRERTTWLAASVLVASSLYGLANGLQHASSRTAIVLEAAQEEQRSFDALAARARPTDDLESGSSGFDPATNPGVLALFYPRVAALAPAPLAALAVGQSDVYPAYFSVTAERRDSFLDEPDLANPTHLLTGRFDVAFVVVALLSLALLLVSYDLLEGERERGTLGLVLSHPVRRRELLVGKVAARAALAIVVVLVVALGLLLTGQLAEDGAPTRLVLWALVVLAYSGFWLGLATAVNLVERSALGNALVLVGLWMLFVVIGPALLHVMVGEVRPVPSRTELILATREADSRSRRPVELLEAYYGAHPEHRPTHPDFRLERYDFPLYWTAIQREVDRLMEPTLKRYDAALERQHRLARWLRPLSPAAVVQDALNDVSGSGLSRHQAFLARVDDFYGEHRRFFEPRIFGKVPIRSDDYEGMPRFDFRDEPAGRVARRVSVDLSLLVVLAVTPVAIEWGRSRRSRAREARDGPAPDRAGGRRHA